MLPERYYELLTILKDAPSTGLSTGDLFKIASDNVKSLIPDPQETSRIVYSLRGSKYITTFDGKKKMHKITPKGLELLEEYLAAKDTEETPTIEPVETEELGTVIDSSEDVFYDPMLGIQESIFHAKQIVTRLKAFLEISDKKPITLTNKSEKVQLLKFLQSFHGKLNSDVGLVLDDIIVDLEAMDEA